MSHTSSAVQESYNNNNMFPSPTHLLKQVSHAAHGVSQLSSKLQADGDLSAVERSILEAHVALLQKKVFQLHGQLLLPVPVHMSHDADYSVQHKSSRAVLSPIVRPSAPHSTATRRSSSSNNSCSCSPPSSPLAAAVAQASGSPQRRRTKRMFNNKACQHCDTQFTSQWRSGPTGPSTLCNACGIRYARQVRQGRARGGQRPEAGTPAEHRSPLSDVSPATSPIVAAASPPPSRASVHFLLN